MKKTLLAGLIGLTIAYTAFAQQSVSLSFSGPTNWTPGTSVTLQCTDTFLNFGGSYGLSYWLEVNSALAPFLTITSVTYHQPFTDGNGVGTFPFSFNTASGADPGFMADQAAPGNGDLGATSNDLVLIPDGTYSGIADITFAIAADAPFGTFTLRTTSVGTRPSLQATSDFNPVYFPPASFVFTINLPTVTSVVSRKVHGGAGTFDIAMPLTGSPGVESRTGGGTNDFTLVITYSGNVTVASTPQAQVTSGTGCIGSGGVCTGNVSVNGAVVTVPLTTIANAQVVNVRINGVTGRADAPATDLNIPIAFLIADVNANHAVNASDIALTKSQIGQPVTASNFRADVNTNGAINAADASLVKIHSGDTLPPQ